MADIHIGNAPLKDGDKFIALKEPIYCDDIPTVCRVLYEGQIAQQDKIFLYLCNNAYDELPNWEDATADLGMEHLFRNRGKSAGDWGIGIIFGVTKSGDEISYIEEIRGNFR